MSTIRLTYTSYVVLGLVELAGPSTPYDMKRGVEASIGNFWSFPHTQLYTEPERLAEAGYLTEEREEGGRRRKVYSLTDSGRQALDAWRSDPTGELAELRDPAVLKLFFGAERGPLGRAQLAAHRRKLAEYEELRDAIASTAPPGPLIALECGIEHERMLIRYWSRLAAEA